MKRMPLILTGKPSVPSRFLVYGVGGTGKTVFAAVPPKLTLSDDGSPVSEVVLNKTKQGSEAVIE